MKTRTPRNPLTALLAAVGLVLPAGLGLAAQVQRTATATATVINGSVVAYTVTDGGLGYTEPPVVTLVGGGGTGATAVALVCESCGFDEPVSSRSYRKSGER
jgi:hypothetical protein